MNAVILSIGDELTTGVTVDTNSAWLSRRLMDHGYTAIRHVTVGDEEERVAGAIAAAAAEADVVLVTGGLGPTADDLTRNGLARAMGVPLREDARSAEPIAAYFAAIGRTMSDSNRLQALLPRGAGALDNACGTAPGIAARLGSADVFVLPGPPNEMMDMFQRQVAPRLRPAGAVVTRALHAFGLGESVIGERIADLMARGRNPAVGTTACLGVISVRIVARGSSPAEADALAAGAADDVRRRLGDIIFGRDEQTLPEVVGRMLADAKATLAVAESCTGGMLGAAITAVPGASRYFLGGVVCYANAAKERLLGVPAELLKEHGAVSAAVAAAMARSARRRFAADWAVAITGIAGPDGGTPEKPVGLVYIALAGPERNAAPIHSPGCADAPAEPQVHRYVFPGSREFIRQRAVMIALNHLRLLLLKARS